MFINLKFIGVHLIRKKTFNQKKNIFWHKCSNSNCSLRILERSWICFKILIIETSQAMQSIPKENSTIWIIVCPLWFFIHAWIQFLRGVQTLCHYFYCVWTWVASRRIYGIGYQCGTLVNQLWFIPNIESQWVSNGWCTSVCRVI
jgi:hypothetical protein